MNYLKWVLKELDTPVKKMLAVLAVLLSLGQLQRFQITTTTAVYLHDFVITGWLGYWLIKERISLPKVRASKVLILVFFITGGYLISWQQHNLQLLALLQLGRLLVYLMFGWTIFMSVKRKKLSTGLLSYFVLLVAVLVGWLGWLQYLFLPDTRFLAINGWDDHYFRLISTQFDPGFTAIILIIGFWIFHNFHINKTKRFLFSLIFTISIAFTYSRAAFVAFGLSLVISAFLVKNKQIRTVAVTSLLALIITIPLLPKARGEGTNLTRTTSVTARQNHLSDYLATFKPYNIVLGNGLFIQPQTAATQSSGLDDHANVSDNWLIVLVSGLGLVGTVFLLRQIAVLALPKLRDDGLLTSQVIAVLTFGLFNNIFQPFVILLMILSWIGVGKKTTPDT